MARPIDYFSPMEDRTAPVNAMILAGGVIVAVAVLGATLAGWGRYGQDIVATMSRTGGWICF